MADVTELLHAARRAVEAGDHKAALPLLDEAAQLGPNLFGVHMLRGICLSALGRHADGVKALQRAIELNPTSAQGHYNLGVAFRSAHRPKDAEKHFRQALRLQPSYEAAAKALRPPAPRPGPDIPTHPSAPAAASTPTPRQPELDRPAPPPPPPQPVEPPPRFRQAVADQPSGRPKRRYVKWVGLAAIVVLAGAATLLALPRRADSSFIAWQARGDFAALDFSPDGELLAAAGDKVTLWRVESGTRYRDFGWGEDAVDCAFAPSGTALAVSSSDEKTGDNVKLWRMPDSGLVAVLPHTAGTRPIAFSPDGKLLAVGTDYMSTASPLGVQLWSVPERKVIGAVASPEVPAAGNVTAIAFSPSGKLIASADDSGAIWISSVADRKRLSAIRTRNMGSTALAFSPSGKTLAYGGSSGPDVTLVGVPDGKPARTLKSGSRLRGKLGLPPAVKAIAFSPDGSLLAACESTGDETRIELFRVSDGAVLKTLDPAQLLDFLGPEAQSPQATGEGGSTSRLLDLRDLQFSRDGHYLAWCGSQGVVVTRVAGLLS